jgi:hypothetical protein
MRRLLPPAAMLILGACATPAQWEKPGADQAVAQHDKDECRTAAQREAFRTATPPFPYGRPYYWGPYRRYPAWRGYWAGYWPGMVYPAWDDRFFTENRLAASCMRSRGYELVPDKDK